jgi:hypothetical protein
MGRVRKRGRRCPPAPHRVKLTFTVPVRPPSPAESLLYLRPTHRILLALLCCSAPAAAQDSVAVPVRVDSLAPPPVPAIPPVPADTVPTPGLQPPPRDSVRRPLAPQPAAPGGVVLALRTIGGPADRYRRLRQVLGHEPAEGGYLLRSPSSQTPRGPNGLQVLMPELESAWNSRIPFSVNDGALWAGRGASARAMAGVAVTAGPVRLIVAPEVVWSANEEFDGLLPEEWTEEERAAFLAPWLTGVHSADVPWRPGAASVRTVYGGQSSLSLYAGPVVAGAATESQWWGPGVRSGIVFSNNAPGFPHLFIRTGRPLRTPAGVLEAKWLVGALASSGYMDGEDDDGERSISALGVTLQPGFLPGLTLGMARSVYSPVDGWDQTATRFGDVFGHWAAGRDSTGRAAEQMLALTARWVSPGDGAEVWVEWARRELPESLRDLMVQPEHGQGYTLGGQLARPWGPGVFRLQAEHTYLEKDPSFRSRPTGSWYASSRVPQGYTERGQVIGAAVGPGGSGQWLAADLVGRRAEGGFFLGRVRWANDAYYDKPGGHNRYLAHDVSVMGGLRGGIDLGGARLSAEWTAGKRYNFLFQNPAISWPDRYKATNVMNHTVRIGLSAAPR